MIPRIHASFMDNITFKVVPAA